MSDAKRKILARRAQFVAAAIASLGVASCGKDSSSRPCLSPAVDPDAAARLYVPEPDAGAVADAAVTDVNAPVDASTPDASKPKPDAGSHPPPRPCLSARPRPCLSQRPPDPTEPF